MVHLFRGLTRLFFHPLTIFVAVLLFAMTAYAQALPGILEYGGARSDVTVILNVADEPTIQDVCFKLTGSRSLACSKIPATAQNFCWVFVPTPSGPDDFRTYALLDHELGHCWGGQWHD